MGRWAPRVLPPTVVQELPRIRHYCRFGQSVLAIAIDGIQQVLNAFEMGLDERAPAREAGAMIDVTAAVHEIFEMLSGKQLINQLMILKITSQIPDTFKRRGRYVQ